MLPPADVVALPVRTEDAVVALYEQHADSLLRVAWLLVGNHHVAEDLVHEAFVKLYVGWQRLQDKDKALPYLRTILVNLARGRARKADVVSRRHLHVVADPASAEDAVLGEEQRKAVVEALYRLPTRQREVLVLRHYAHLGESEIAETLDISVGSVRTHTKRGLAALEKALEGQR